MIKVYVPKKKKTFDCIIQKNLFIDGYRNETTLFTTNVLLLLTDMEI